MFIVSQVRIWIGNGHPVEVIDQVVEFESKSDLDRFVYNIKTESQCYHEKRDINVDLTYVEK